MQIAQVRCPYASSVADAEPFPVMDTSDWEITQDETAGAGAKLWLTEPGTGTGWMFKSVTVKQGHVHGEDWAEKAAAHIAGFLGVPCARVEMATWKGFRGSIAASLRPRVYDLQPGRVLLEDRNAPGYVHRSKGQLHPGHSVANIRAALDGVLPPPDCDLPFGATAFDVFAGYLVLDAWIANRDRHDNNWSVLKPSTTAGPLRLCGSYDHANSLGYNLTDGERARRLDDERQLLRWCEKGTAWRFEYPAGGPVPTLAETAASALRLASADARAHWTEQLGRVDDDNVRQVLARVPGMSEPARNFAARVLEVNRRRVLDACA